MEVGQHATVQSGEENGRGKEMREKRVYEMGY
jgi:hypothetical protein